MTLGIMQPYFFPYLGYIHMIALCDMYVVFDTSQYTSRSWMNRNRVFKHHASKETWQYITVALEKTTQKTALNKVNIKNKAETFKDTIKKMEHYKKFAPHYNEVVKIVTECFENTKTDLLVDLNVESLKSVCKYLDIKFEPIIFSQEKIELPEITYAGQWALEISTFYKAHRYLNPPAGKDIFKEEEFAKRGIELSFMPMPDFSYDCSPYTFEPHLSILDILMWNSKDKVQEFIAN